MTIRDILRRKGSEVVTITGDRSVLQAVETLVDHNIGSLVVMKDDALTGIITERDILRLTAGAAGKLGTIKIESVMTRDLLTAEADDGLHETMSVMTERRVRHLPVVEKGTLIGIVSIGDLINACLMFAEDENEQLRRYIHRGG